MEINVGEYVRTRDGIIKRVISYNPQENNPLWETLNGNVQMKGTITKHSKDIIDLIEVGDYVNDYRVVETYNATGEQMIFITILTDKGYKTILNNKFENKYIKSILTYEQFESNAYKIEKEG